MMRVACIAAALVSGTSASGGHDTAHGSAHHDTMEVVDLPNVCKSGVMQSPIDLKTCSAKIKIDDHDEVFNIPNEREDMSISYGSGKMTLEKVCHDTGCELKVTPASETNNVLTVPGSDPHHPKVYNLDHCNVRIPAEHTINGHQFPLEVQCQHTLEHTGNRRKGILSTLYMVQKSSGFLSNLATHMPAWDKSKKMSTKREASGGIAPIGTAAKSRYYTYSGSQTTGDCTEDVDWIVMYDPTGMSGGQFEALKKNMSDTTLGWMPNRPIQNLFGREPTGCPEHHGEPGNALAAGLSTVTFAVVLSFLFA